MKKVYRLIFAFLVTAFLLSATNRDDLFLVSRNLDVFAALFKEVNINYVDETNSSSMVRSGINAMLADLDPYTEFVPESEIEAFRLKYVSAQFGGIGASTIQIKDRFFINEVSENNPALNAGLLPGDELMEINNISLKGKDRNQLGVLLRGPKGSKIDLVINRSGEVLKKTLTRDLIVQKNVTYSGMIDGNLGYIKLDKFLENAYLEVRNAAIELNKHQPAGLILDLRGNGGGILQEAVKIVNLFVKRDLVIVVQKGRNVEKNVVYKTLEDPLLPELPLVVLINGSSASASEIVAGALQDLDRAVIVGQKSYGKGLVQQTFNLPYNSLVKITVAKYYTPSGRCIQALDYTSHNKIQKGTDSLKKIFTTKSGRTVYDGNGIYPDFTVPSEPISTTGAMMLNKAMFFDFANNYKKLNPSVTNSKRFQLSDAEFTAFLNSLPTVDDSFSAKTNQLINELVNEAKKDQRYDVVKMDIDKLKAKMSLSPKEAFINHKQEIKRLLESQIISRYFLEKGRIEQSFQYDKEMEMAVEILSDSQKVKEVLSGKGNYKKIGDSK
ncbi:S41 family peptidase [Pedobacter flavus]|uniref:S41 family peptidase n=1 Tax=Pedobacter flavus TaxID=3113906 RepID=A0ABU7H0K2_9SPHI|nr:S41 family peptidase [Pedobacter sp. VNH31]MEE1884612.1 S41 family peptidase [Pedobacter sp. VNH31]